MAGNASKQGWLRPCTCGHLQRWHRGDICRILNCECDSYVEQRIVYRPVDGSWLRGGRRVSAARHRTRSVA